MNLGRFLVGCSGPDWCKFKEYFLLLNINKIGVHYLKKMNAVSWTLAWQLPCFSVFYALLSEDQTGGNHVTWLTALSLLWDKISLLPKTLPCKERGGWWGTTLYESKTSHLRGKEEGESKGKRRKVERRGKERRDAEWQWPWQRLPLCRCMKEVSIHQTANLVK